MPDELESKSARELAMLVMGALYTYASRPVATEALLELFRRAEMAPSSALVQQGRALIQWQEAQRG